MRIKRNILNRLNLSKPKLIGIIAALITIILAYLFLRKTNLFLFIMLIAVIIGIMPFIISLMMENKRQTEIDMMFLEFSKNLVESVKSGTPISKSILNVRTKDYGHLNPYIDKLANQISLGIPVKVALETFARDANSSTIKRAVAIISESEKAGGQIDAILESVVRSVSQTEKLKKERQAAMYTLVVQGYIIFMIFIAIMIVMQYNVLPIAAGMSGDFEGVFSGGGIPGFNMGISQTSGEGPTAEELARPFIYVLGLQGIFAGLVIGKLSEGNVKAGLKHSFILTGIALLISIGAKTFLG